MRRLQSRSTLKRAKTVASVEKFESYPFEKTTAPGTTYSSAGGKQAEDTVNVGQRYIRAVDGHGQVPGMHRTRPRQDACVRHPNQESYTQKQLRRPQGAAGPTILTGGSKETQEQMRSSKRFVFTGGACDECEYRETEELVGLEERAESTSKGVCAERRRIQQTLLRVCLKTSSRNCVVAKS